MVDIIEIKNLESLAQLLEKTTRLDMGTSTPVVEEISEDDDVRRAHKEIARVGVVQFFKTYLQRIDSGFEEFLNLIRKQNVEAPLTENETREYEKFFKIYVNHILVARNAVSVSEVFDAIESTEEFAESQSNFRVQ
jgi:hypothetical protein